MKKSAPKDTTNTRDWDKCLVPKEEVLHPDPRTENELLVARMMVRMLERRRLQRDAQYIKDKLRECPLKAARKNVRDSTENYNAHLNRISKPMRKPNH